LRVGLGYPDPTQEVAILRRLQRVHPIETLGPVVDAHALGGLVREVWEVNVDATVEKYIVGLTRQTREHPDVALGVSPRGSLALFKTAQAYAALHGRDYVLPDDVKHMVPFALYHRVICKPESTLRGRTARQIVNEIVDRAELQLAE
jgi:MoxR-like ATPase